MIAIGADHGRLHRLAPISAGRPEECWFQNDLLCRIALRLIEMSGRLGQSEDIAHSVITNTVARAELLVSVVVEGAPAESARILSIGCKLIVHARVPPNVLGKMLTAVIHLGRIRMPNEFRI